MALGLGTGIALGPTVGFVNPATGTLIGSALALPGQLFLASILLGLASSENAEQLKRLGVTVTVYFIATTAMTAAIGFWIASIMRPGIALGKTVVSSTQALESPTVLAPPGLSELPEVLIGLLPGNPLGSMVEGQMLQIVIFSIIVGIAHRHDADDPVAATARFADFPATGDSMTNIEPPARTS
ncbi:MAG: cation:dicarboxylate symporter family transporter [Gammaproteobacteria bacterium]